MPFDAVVTNPGRLKILTALAVEEQQEFTDLRRRTSLTDGNLAAHAKRLQAAGLIDIDKQFRSGKPVTRFVLTEEGRKALESHTRKLIAALSQRRSTPMAVEVATSRVASTPVPPPASKPTPEPATVPAEPEWAEDEWVD